MRRPRAAPERPVPAGTWLVRENGVLRALTPVVPGEVTIMQRFDDVRPESFVLRDVTRVGAVVRVRDEHGAMREFRPEPEGGLGLEDVGTVKRNAGLRERLRGADLPMAGSGNADGTALAGLALLPVALVTLVGRGLRAPVRRRADVRRAIALQHAIMR